jgi:hypothetical protein
MIWQSEQQGQRYASGDYELVRWEKGSFARRWGVCYRGNRIETVHSLADAKWLAEDHWRGTHESRLEESGNAIMGGVI